jgi:hypothetical protein
MDKVFIYDNFKHLTKNPPVHKAIDYIFNNCEHEIMPFRISSHEIIHKNKIILSVYGICQIHGKVNYLVTFIK